ncbi:helix-turn-helix domain-containing protein [Enterococcus canis]|uniref:helix-turn-helix domain-containing protein n=1 Tax=Enterococcus canis TaxID=214095 RepID=UPI0008311D61|nr:helix-turn-helix domain-containing protein [Enterococcus canis]
MIDLNQVLTFTEAAEKWGLANGSTIRQAALRGKFTDEEVRKSGTVWLTTYDAMLRVFGAPLKPSLRLSLTQLNQRIQAHDLVELEAALAAGRQLQITEEFLGKERLLYLFQTPAEFHHWQHLTRHSFPRKDT